MVLIRRISVVLLAATLAVPLVSCDKLNQMMGKKEGEKPAAEQEAPPTEQKIQELEAKIQKMEEEAKAKAEAEAKAKEEEELRAKIEEEVKAKLAAETQKTPEEAAKEEAKKEEAKKEEPAKVVERVIVKEVPAPTPAPSATAEAKPSRASGYVRLYDDAGFTDRILTVPFGRNIGNFHYVNSDDGKAGFNDKCSSVKWSVPPGWKAVIYENNNYAKRGYPLKGSGSIADLGYFGDKCSSIRWERSAD